MTSDPGTANEKPHLPLSVQQYQRLVGMLESKPTVRGRWVRQTDRFPYVLESGMVVDIMHPGSSHARVWVMPRNLSEGGIAVFHSGFIHPQSRCIIHLTRRDGVVSLQRGRVMHCRYLFGRIHELGAGFDQRIDVRQFMEIPAEG